MNGLNKIFLLGRIGNDPELRSSQGGKVYTRFSVATRRYSSQVNESGKNEATTWHSVCVWGKLGETCAKFLRKGSPVFVEGHMSSYTTEKDGQRRYMTDIVADKIEFLPRRNKDNESERTFDS